MNLIKRFAYAPFYSQLVIIRKCNLSCSYCNEYDKDSDPISFQTLKERAEKLKQLGVFSIGLTGGEPTMHPDLIPLIRYITNQLELKRVSMITNGFYLTKDLILELNKSGLQDLQISIDGVEANNSTVKILNSLKSKLELLANYAKFNVIVSGVLGVCDPDETFQVIKYAKDKKFRPRVLLVHDHDGQLKLNEKELKVYENVKKLTQKHFYEISNYRDKLVRNGEAEFKCRAGSRYLYVDEFGDVSWCSQTRDVFKKPLLEYQYSDLKEQFYSYKSCQKKCTVGCVRSASAYDNWRKQDSLN